MQSTTVKSTVLVCFASPDSAALALPTMLGSPYTFSLFCFFGLNLAALQPIKRQTPVGCSTTSDFVGALAVRPASDIVNGPITYVGTVSNVTHAGIDGHQVSHINFSALVQLLTMPIPRLGRIRFWSRKMPMAILSPLVLGNCFPAAINLWEKL